LCRDTKLFITYGWKSENCQIAKARFLILASIGFKNHQKRRKVTIPKTTGKIPWETLEISWPKIIIEK
jgi:hypothetical protein